MMNGSNGQPEGFSAPSLVPEADPVLEIPGIEDIDEVKSLHDQCYSVAPLILRALRKV